MIKKVLKDIIDLPKTLYVNFKCFPIKKAMKLPIKINHRVKIGKLHKGCFEVNCKCNKYMIKLGFSGAGFVSENKSYIYIGKGKVVFNGSCTIGEGFNIYINGGILKIEDNLYANRNLEIQCEKGITIGKDCLIGWNVSIRDTDGHKLIKEGKMTEEKGEINVGKHVWIASHSSVLKESVITDGSVIGCKSLVCGIKMKEMNCLIAGIPAKVIRNNIFWEE